MTSSTSPKLALRLIQRLKKQQAKSPNAFTLVELMVVVAIVGILSAIALPNFLSQADKAKATEAKTHIGATLKAAHAKYLEDGENPETTNTGMTDEYGTPEAGETKFDYAVTAPAFSNSIYTVTATGNDTDSGLDGKEIAGCVNFDTGKVDIGSKLEDSASDVDCAASS